MSLNLRPLSEIVTEIKTTTEVEITHMINNARTRAVERIQRVELTRQALALLDGAGVVLPDVGCHEYPERVRLKLGYFPRTRKGNRALAMAVRQVRVALGCRLEEHGKDASERKGCIDFTYRAVDYPGVLVCWTRRASGDDRCKVKVVRSTYRTVVCDLS